jgi:hypothetical protein
MARGREFEIFDEPEPGAPVLGGERNQPGPEARLTEPDERSASRERNGYPAPAGRWARHTAAVATLAAAAAAVAMLLVPGADHGGRERLADQGKRVPDAQQTGRVPEPPSGEAPSSSARPRAKRRTPVRRRPRPGGVLAGGTGPVAPSPPPVAQVPPALTTPPPPPAGPAPTLPPPRPATGPTRPPVGDLPAPAAPKSPFEP